MHAHPSTAKLFRNLLLTSSLDWTVKLWNLALSDEPVMEFGTPTYDYICDVQWSPVHAAVFGAITSGGTLTLWNLSKSTLEAMDSIKIRADDDGSKGPSSFGLGGSSNTSAALNKMIWSNDGKQILIGDAKGSIHSIQVTEAAAKPKPGDEGRFELAILHRKDFHSGVSDVSAGGGEGGVEGGMERASRVPVAY